MWAQRPMQISAPPSAGAAAAEATAGPEESDFFLIFFFGKTWRVLLRLSHQGLKIACASQLLSDRSSELAREGIGMLSSQAQTNGTPFRPRRGTSRIAVAAASVESRRIGTLCGPPQSIQTAVPSSVGPNRCRARSKTRGIRVSVRASDRQHPFPPPERHPHDSPSLCPKDSCPVEGIKAPQCGGPNAKRRASPARRQTSEGRHQATGQSWHFQPARAAR